MRAEVIRRASFRCAAAEISDARCSPGLEVDEIQGRGRRPGSHLDPEECQVLCPRCHMLKTRYPRIAGLLGLYGEEELLRRLAEASSPVERLLVAVEAAQEWDRRKRQAGG